MKIWRLLGLFLLLWTELEWVCGEETLTNFMRDVMATFRLKSPTIVYDSDEAPELCYKEKWVLCLSAPDKERDLKSLVDKEVCLDTKGSKCIFPFTYRGVTHQKCTIQDNPQPYCSVKNDENGNILLAGLCSSKDCPYEDSKYFNLILFEVAHLV